MALKAVHVSDVPSLDKVPETTPLDLSSQPRFLREANKVDGEPKKMLVIGHRGSGMNVVQSSDRRMRAIRENSILSFEAAAAFPVDFVEFDVQNLFDKFLSLEETLVNMIPTYRSSSAIKKNV